MNRKAIQIKKLSDFDYVLDRQTIFTQRKKALISRDPLTKTLLKMLDEYRPSKNDPSDEEIESARQRLADKWNVNIIITGAAKPFVTGLPVMKNQIREDCLSPIKFCYDGIEILEMEPLIISNKIAGNPIESSYWPFAGSFSENKAGTVNICVNVSLLDSHDEREMKEACWLIIRKHVPKNKPKSKVVDIQELSFIYDIRTSTFERYMRWYDHHMNETSDRFTFRAIALCEYASKKDPALYEETKKRIPERIKIIKSSCGVRTYKGAIGETVRGEDAVEKAVKLIYRAIHRKPYPSKKAKQQEYNCPDHGVSCKKDCKYLQQFMKDFNRRNALYLPLTTTSDESLSRLTDENLEDAI